MASIVRNGQTIVLTDEEVRQIRDEEHRNDIRYEIEEAIARAIEDEQISFDSWEHNEAGVEYSSEDDARSDFVEYILEHILDEEDTMSEHASPDYRFVPNYDSEVIDTAEEFGYLKGE